MYDCKCVIYVTDAVINISIFSTFKNHKGEGCYIFFGACGVNLRSHTPVLN